MFFNNNNNDFQMFLEKYSLTDVQKDYPVVIEEIYKSLRGNFSESVVNVNIRQNFIIIDLLERLNLNIEKIIKEK